MLDLDSWTISNGDRPHLMLEATALARQVSPVGDAAGERRPTPHQAPRGARRAS